MVGLNIKEKEEEKDSLDILNSGGQEGLLAHITDAEHTSKAQAAIDFSLRERTFNCRLRQE